MRGFGKLEKAKMWLRSSALVDVNFENWTLAVSHRDFMLSLLHTVSLVGWWWLGVSSMKMPSSNQDSKKAKYECLELHIQTSE